MIEADLQDWLKVKSGVDCFQQKAPQRDITPKVVWSFPSEETLSALDGPTSLVKRELNIRIYSDDYIESKQIKERIGLALNGFRGEIGGSYIPCVRLNNTSEEFEEPFDVGEIGNAKIEMEFDFWVGG